MAGNENDTEAVLKYTLLANGTQRKRRGMPKHVPSKEETQTQDVSDTAKTQTTQGSNKKPQDAHVVQKEARGANSATLTLNSSSLGSKPSGGDGVDASIYMDSKPAKENKNAKQQSNGANVPADSHHAKASNTHAKRADVDTAAVRPKRIETQTPNNKQSSRGGTPYGVISRNNNDSSKQSASTSWSANTPHGKLTVSNLSQSQDKNLTSTEELSRGHDSSEDVVEGLPAKPKPSELRADVATFACRCVFACVCAYV